MFRLRNNYIHHRRLGRGAGRAILNAWDDLRAELDAWAEAGRTATLWWRDDDAVSATPALERLLAISGRCGVPLSLAVIPAPATVGLAERTCGEAGIAVLVHGLHHRNHAAAGEKKCEFPARRAIDDMAADMALGLARISELFGRRALPVLVPPWNRIAPVVAKRLPALGYRGLSTHGPRRAMSAAPGVSLVNSHIDPIAWRGGRGFRGDDAVLAEAIGHLRQRRVGAADPGEPTGLLTHHLVHDAGTWSFMERFLAFAASHRAVRWLDGATVFPGATGDDTIAS